MMKTFEAVTAIVIAATIAFSAPASAQTAPASTKVTTKDGHVACKKRVWMEDMLTFIRTDNKAKYRHYIETKRCLFTKGGLEVKLLEKQEAFGVIVGFEYNRETLWTYWTSLTYHR